MIAQITPLVKEANRRIWIHAVVAHIAGATISATCLGFALGTAGEVLGLQEWRGRVMVSALIFLVCAFHVTGAISCRIPSYHRQTPRWFRQEFGPVWGAFAWGIDLGQGWTTRIELAGYYSLIAWSLLAANPILGATVMGIFGVSRGLPVLVAGTFVAHEKAGPLGFEYLRNITMIQSANAFGLAMVGAYLIIH